MGCTFFLAFLVGKGIAGPIYVPETVEATLLKRGVSKKAIQTYFKGPLRRVELKIILKNVTHKEVMADYRRFLKEKTIRETKGYLTKYKIVFDEIEKTYQVPKEVVASILMMESSFGRNDGKYLVFSVYASLASLIDREIRRRVTEKVLESNEDVKFSRFRKRIARKAKWGMKELTCLIRLSEDKKINPFHLKGSWAGAFGMPQFIPTSFEAYGVDWNGDGKVNLSDLPDASASAANYLRKHGWKGKMTQKKALRVIKTYNLSQPYAITVLKMSERLK